jgi:hypothetical protein
VLGVAFYTSSDWRAAVPAVRAAARGIRRRGRGARAQLARRLLAAHYGLALLSIVAAGSASLRQISLHVIPDTGHYGSALFGFHFYTLAFVGYGALVVYIGAMLMITRSVDERLRGEPAGAAAKLACWIFMLLAAANAAAFLAECDSGRVRTIRRAIFGGRNPSRLAHHQHGHRAVRQDLRRLAAEQKARKPAPAVRRHHDASAFTFLATATIDSHGASVITCTTLVSTPAALAFAETLSSTFAASAFAAGCIPCVNHLDGHAVA